MQALADVADRLFDLVIDIDPAHTTWERIEESAREKCRALEHEIEKLKEQLRHQSAEALEESVKRAVREALESIAANIAELRDAVSERAAGSERWRRLYASFAKNYDALTKALAPIKSLGSEKRFRKLTPTNYTRNLFHVAGGITGALLYHYFLTQTLALVVMVVFVVTFTSLEILRRRSDSMNELLMRFPFFRRIARPREYYQVNSSTFYAWGMLTCVALFPRQAVEAACVVLAVGDPFASNLGRRFGRIKIYKDKSLVGSAAFFVSSAAALFAFQRVVYSGQTVGFAALVAALGAFIGTAAEALSARWDDNLTVPLAVACALSFITA
jgi:dolichol kinase